MSDPGSSEYRALMSAVGELRITAATLNGAVKALEATVTRMEKNSVSQEAHDALKKDVVDLEIEARAGIARNDTRWERMLWAVFVLVLLAGIGFLMAQGGGQPS